MIGQTRKSNPLKRNRLGVSLAELLVAMTIGSVVMAIGLGMLHLMLKTDRTLADSLQRRQTVSQLSRAFRRDVHAANKAELLKGQNEQDPPGLSLQAEPNRRVRYSAEENTVLRVETEGEKTIQTARYRFAKGTLVSFQIEESGRVGLTIRSPNPSTNSQQTAPDAPLRELTIEATKGRDHRFIPPSESENE